MVSIGWTSSGGHGPLLADGRVARVGQHVAAVGGFDPATLRSSAVSTLPRAPPRSVSGGIARPSGRRAAVRSSWL